MLTCCRNSRRRVFRSVAEINQNIHALTSRARKQAVVRVPRPTAPSRSRLVNTCGAARVRIGDCEKTRGQCCRRLARKVFPKLPRKVPGFFHGADFFTGASASGGPCETKSYAPNTIAYTRSETCGTDDCTAAWQSCCF